MRGEAGASPDRMASTQAEREVTERVWVVSVEGACMRPFVWPGGRLSIVRCALDDLEIGDVAVFFDGADLVAHRVLGRREGALVTRGDLSSTLDPPFAASQLAGRATRFDLGRVGWRLDGPVVGRLGRVVAEHPWIGRAVGDALRRASSWRRRRAAT